jgi:TPR repeat protein
MSVQQMSVQSLILHEDPVRYVLFPTGKKPTGKKPSENEFPDGMIFSQHGLTIQKITLSPIETRKKEVLTSYQTAASLGYPYYQYLLHNLYVRGFEVEKDLPKALELLKQSADGGFKESQFEFGLRLMGGKDIEKDYDEGIQYITKAADNGLNEASLILAFHYKSEVAENDLASDISQTHFYLKRAAEGGLKEAQFLLARRYSIGDCVEKDDKLSFGWFVKAANQGIAEAAYIVSECYTKGLGTVPDASLSFTWCKTASDAGSMNAKFTLGEFFLKGLGCQKNEQHAFKCFNKCSHLPKKNGLYTKDDMFDEAMSYMIGQGEIKKDVSKAIRYLEILVYCEYPKAQYELGSYLIAQRNVGGAHIRAVKLFKNTIENGKSDDVKNDSSYAIGKCYLDGKGVPTNKSSAYEWFKLAANNGHQKAQELLNRFVAEDLMTLNGKKSAKTSAKTSTESSTESSAKSSAKSSSE